MAFSSVPGTQKSLNTFYKLISKANKLFLQIQEANGVEWEQQPDEV